MATTSLGIPIPSKEASPGSGLLPELRALALAIDVLIAAAGSPSLLTADLVNSTTVFANLTDLTKNVLAGRKYSFRAILFINDSNAEGVKFDLAGGTATATNLRATYIGYDTALSLIAHVAALATVASVDSFSGVGKIEIEGTLEPATDGTFIPRMAQMSHTAGSLTILKDSTMVMSETL